MHHPATRPKEPSRRRLAKGAHDDTSSDTSGMHRARRGGKRPIRGAHRGRDDRAYERLQPRGAGEPAQLGGGNQCRRPLGRLQLRLGGPGRRRHERAARRLRPGSADRQDDPRQRHEPRPAGRAARDPFGGSVAEGISANGRFVVFRSDAANLVAGDTNPRPGHLRPRPQDRPDDRGASASPAAAGKLAAGATSPQSARTAVTSPSARTRRTWSRATRTALWTSSSVTGSRGRRSGSASVAAASRQTGRASSRRSARTAATSRSSPMRRTSSPATRTALARLRPRPEVGPDDQGQRRQPWSAGCRRPDAQRQQRPGDQRRRPLCRLPLGGVNLVPGDTNGVFDIFVHDLKTGTTERMSISSSGKQADAESLGPPVISADGHYVAFGSLATNLVPGDRNDTPTRSSAIYEPARRRSSASAAAAPRAPTRAGPTASPRSARAAATWPSRPGPGSCPR